MKEYVRCSACWRVLLDEDEKYWGHKLACPFCKVEHEMWQKWPPTGTLDFLRIANNQDKFDGDGIRVSLVFVCTSVEILLDDVIDGILGSYNKYGPYNQIIKDSFNGKSRKEELFHKLHGKSLSKVISDDIDKEFYKNWQQLTKIRNGLIHGYYWAHSLEEWPIKEVADNCIRVFMEVNNRARDFIDSERK